MPKKLTASGNAAPERKAAPKAAAKSAPAKNAPKAEKAPVKSAKPAVQEMKPRFGPGSEKRTAPTLPKGGQAIVIGKGGKVQTTTAKPAQSKPAARPAAKPGKQPLAKPVQRVNRARGRNGER
jgi:DnaK suppressor protein